MLELDLHGLDTRQAKTVIDGKLRQTDVARIRLIHGYRGGTALRNMIRTRYRNHPKVLRVELGLNPGETDLVLRER